MRKAIVAIILAAGLLYGCWHPSETKIKSKVVMLSGNHAFCSGEQVKAPSDVNYILTAGHCKDLAVDGKITIITEDGKTLDRRIVAEDPKSDLLLLEGLPGVEGLPIAKGSYKGQWVRTFTHGHRMATYKTEGFLVQDKEIEIQVGDITNQSELEACSGAPKYKVISMDLEISGNKVSLGALCIMQVIETVTTAGIVPGSSGGAIVNGAGELVGVASAGDKIFGYLVTLADIRAFVANY